MGSPGNPICFNAGTQIEVENGETVNVEDLVQGDMVMTADNGPQPVKWIGLNTFSAAKHLVVLEGIDVAEDVMEVTYVQFLCDQHEVVFANGAPSESLYTGPQALKSVPAEAVAEIMALFPELADVNYQALSARTMANGRMGRQLAIRHKNKNRPLLETFC